jgi:hypothetical protein
VFFNPRRAFIDLFMKNNPKVTLGIVLCHLLPSEFSLKGAN